MWQLTIDVLPLKTARHDASANLKYFGASRPNFTMRRCFMRSHQLHLPPSVWQSLVWPRLLSSVCGTRKQNLGSVDKSSRPILSRLWAKVHEILGQYRGPVVLNCNDLARLSMACFSRETFAVKSRSR